MLACIPSRPFVTRLDDGEAAPNIAPLVPPYCCSSLLAMTACCISLGAVEISAKENRTGIDRISGGERPITSLMYIESTAVGISEKEATDALANQLSQLQTLFNAFDLSISRVVGRELYYLHKFNYRTYDFAEINKFFQVQK